MPARTAHLGLGSNVGDRREHLRVALRLMEEHGIEVEAVSSAYETEPVGEILDQPYFLNAAARVRTELEPLELLDRLKAIEVEQGRMLAGPKHGPRPLDVDLLLMEDIELEHERLRLPHRDLTARRFVLIPLLELEPDLALPDGTKLSDCLARLKDPEGQEVRIAGPVAGPEASPGEAPTDRPA